MSFKSSLLKKNFQLHLPLRRRVRGGTGGRLLHATAVAKSLLQNAVEYLISIPSHQDAFERALGECRMPHAALLAPIDIGFDICLLLVAHSVHSAANCMAYRKMESILLIRRWPTTVDEGVTHIANGLIFAQFVITTDWPIRFCKRLAMLCKYLQLLVPPPTHRADKHSYMHMHMHLYSNSYTIQYRVICRLMDHIKLNEKSLQNI